jgi:tetratricopeptide (TPR) repeat protein
MGVGYLNLCKYAEAIDALEGVSFSDELVGAVAKGALGDAYLELGEIDNAISSYTDAVNHNDNEFTVPVYLKKLAIAHEQVKENGKAIAAYKRIVADYPASKEAKDAAKYIAMLEAK